MTVGARDVGELVGGAGGAGAAGGGDGDVDGAGGSGGAVAVIWVALLTVNASRRSLPKLTAVAPVKLVPVIVTVVPPAAGPAVGLTLCDGRRR